MTSLRTAKVGDLAFIAALETQPHAQRFVTAMSVEEHRTLFAMQDVVYLIAEIEPGRSAGYFLLILDGDGKTVELRRVVVSADARGIGQTAMKLAMEFCRDSLHRERIWLDAYADNHRGIHVYKKLGFALSRKEPRGDRTLHFYSVRL